MNHLFIKLLLVLLVFEGCKPTLKQTKIKYSPRLVFENQTKYVYTLAVPKGGKLQKYPIQMKTEYSQEFRVLYPDSSIIYILNDNFFGAMLNSVNCWGMGRGPRGRNPGDTTVFIGNQKDGKFWRQDFIGDVTIGYVNVPADKKDLFDKSLGTLHRRKK